MEPLFLSVICGCNAGLFREALHEVYIRRIQRGNSAFAAKVLGARGALLTVLAHFFDHGRWGSPVETANEGQSLSAEDQLFILMQAASYLTATQGLGAREAPICYERAEPLCHSLGRPLLLCVALIGRWRYSLYSDKMTATMQIAERIHLLAQEQNDSTLMIEACRALACTLYFLGEFQKARQYAMRGVQLWRSGNVQSYTEDPYTPVVACLCFLAGSEWHFGEIAACKAHMLEAISLAKELNDMHGLAVALIFAGLAAHLEHDPSGVERLASDAIELSMRQNFAAWLAMGTVLRGWARSVTGDPMGGIPWIERGIEGLRVTGSTREVPHCLGLKAEALHLANRTSEALAAIEEAEKIVERSEEREWCAELQRLRGVFLTKMGAARSEIEKAFSKAISTAKQQKSISLERRAEETYAEYRRKNASGSGGSEF
jgi:hypothetical protein